MEIKMREMRELEPQRLVLGEGVAWTFDRGPRVGEVAPRLELPDAAFKMWSLEEFAGRSRVVATVPTFETPAGRESLARLLEIARAKPGCEIFGVSVDVPFALVRVLDEARPPENLRVLSAFRSPEVGMEWGTLLVEHPMMGLLARAVFVVGGDGRVKSAEVAKDVLEQPDWEKASAALDEP